MRIAPGATSWSNCCTASSSRTRLVRLTAVSTTASDGRAPQPPWNPGCDHRRGHGGGAGREPRGLADDHHGGGIRVGQRPVPQDQAHAVTELSGWARVAWPAVEGQRVGEQPGRRPQVGHRHGAGDAFGRPDGGADVVHRQRPRVVPTSPTQTDESGQTGPAWRGSPVRPLGVTRLKVARLKVGDGPTDDAVAHLAGSAHDRHGGDWARAMRYLSARTASEQSSRRRRFVLPAIACLVALPAISAAGHHGCRRGVRHHDLGGRRREGRRLVSTLRFPRSTVRRRSSLRPRRAP